MHNSVEKLLKYVNNDVENHITLSIHKKQLKSTKIKILLDEIDFC